MKVYIFHKYSKEENSWTGVERAFLKYQDAYDYSMKKHLSDRNNDKHSLLHIKEAVKSSIELSEYNFKDINTPVLLFPGNETIQGYIVWVSWKRGERIDEVYYIITNAIGHVIKLLREKEYDDKELLEWKHSELIEVFKENISAFNITT